MIVYVAEIYFSIANMIDLHNRSCSFQIFIGHIHCQLAYLNFDKNQ